jgi:hypothetical protein
MDMDAPVSLGALIILTLPTTLLAVGACVLGSCGLRQIREHNRAISALRNALYVPQPQYYPLGPTAPLPTAPLMSA